MTAAPIPVGSRVVLVEDNKFGGTVFGEKGERGVVTLIDDEGDYEVRFDGEIDDWAVNASAVALESQGHDAALTAWERDTALGMALELADQLRDDYSFTLWQRNGNLLVADWLRDCVAHELWGDGDDGCLSTPFRKVK